MEEKIKIDIWVLGLDQRYRYLKEMEEKIIKEQCEEIKRIKYNISELYGEIGKRSITK